MTTRVKSYIWKNGDQETSGAQIRHSGRAQVFVPLEELVRVSDELIDIVERHERAKPVKRADTVNTEFDRLSDH